MNSSLSINSHAHANVANSLVFTPEQAANLEKQRSTLVTPTEVESTSQEKDKMGNLVQYMGEAIQHGDELLQNIVDSSSTAISTPQKEKTDSDKKVDLGIDLNKTPQQKPPKRKKHRPKVIVEGKPKRTRKPVQPKNTVSGENLPAKRKYVRKNKPKNLTAQEVDVTGETRDPGTGTAQKTCKRVLIFDMEKTGDETHDNVVAQQEVQNMNKSTTSMAGNYQPTGLGNGTNQACGMMRSAESGLPKSLMVENQIPGQMSSDTHFTRTPPDRQAALAPLASTQDQQLRNFYVAGRPVISANADQWKNRMADKYILMQQQTLGEGTGQNGLLGKADYANLERAKEIINLERIRLIMQIMPQQAPMTPSKFYEARGSKREHCQTTEQANLSTSNHAGSSLYDKPYQVDEYHRNGHILRTGFLQTHKKNKIGGGYRDIQNMPSSIKAADGGLGNTETKRADDANPIGQKSRLNCTILNSHLQGSRVADRINDQENKYTSDMYVHPMASGQNSPKQQISSKIHSHSERMASTWGLNPFNGISTQTTIEKYKYLVHIPSRPEVSTGPRNGQTFQTWCSMSEKRQTVGAPLLKSASSRVDKLQEPSLKRRGTFLIGKI